MKKNDITVSVLIPVLNGEKTLEQCLKSVLNQSFNGYEVIVVDNNSTDRTKEILKKYQKKSRRIKYVFEPKRGRGSARNAGIRTSKGNIIAMTDSDCIVPNHWLSKITEPILNEGENAVMGFEKDIGKSYWSNNIQSENQILINKVISGKYINHLDTKNFAIKANLLKELKFDERLGNMEDLDLYIRLSKRTKILFLSELKVKHFHKNTFTSTVKIYFDRGWWVAKIHKNKNYNSSPMFESISLVNFLKFPAWIFLQFLTKDPGKACFLLVSDLSWRAGVVAAII